MAKTDGKKSVRKRPEAIARPATPSGFPERLKWHSRQGLWYENFRDPTTNKRKMVYFGNDVNQAWADFLRNKDALDSGVALQEQDDKPVTVIQLAEAFLENLRVRLLTANERRGKTSDIDTNTFQRHKHILEIVCKAIGTRNVNELEEIDFLRLMPQLGKSAHTQWNGISSVRSLFLFGSKRRGKFRTDIPNYGSSFRCASLAERSDDKHRVVKKKDSEWSAEQIRFFLYQYETHRPGSSRVATARIRACLLLGINCGFYAKCCSDLRWTELDLEKRLYNGIRFKTQRTRASILWPETVTAIINGGTRQSNSEFVFLSGQGRNLVCNTDVVTIRCNACHRKSTLQQVPQTDLVCEYCRTLTRRVDIAIVDIRTNRSDQIGNSLIRTYRRLGLTPGDPSNPSFKWLRHTFANVAKRGDWQTLQFAMGHARNEITHLYADDVDQKRLQLISDMVREWLWQRPCSSCGELSVQPGNQWLCLSCHTANTEFDGDDVVLAKRIYV